MVVEIIFSMWFHYEVHTIPAIMWVLLGVRWAVAVIRASIQLSNRNMQ